jgi:hypothetical protein
LPSAKNDFWILDLRFWITLKPSNHFQFHF